MSPGEKIPGMRIPSTSGSSKVVNVGGQRLKVREAMGLTAGPCRAFEDLGSYFKCMGPHLWGFEQWNTII